ncbi:tyrosine-type recombinase/integrase [Mesorhizobium sp. VK4C]|uniref:tyrosine-type recombinase/integrase n=1 Tax=Mesorhizobium captivum TaxID=3072319 RepID=UPI002A23B9F7|nr:tyrosine-type recombinase/integrase [Mesorhizobium sp. VK4C]MDX8499050.1 tyrosine-type recombinase/integrase [Mesorhizobium sp. VK4C]
MTFVTVLRFTASPSWYRQGADAATHLLRASVDINTVRGWLGHVSLDTTNVYAEVDFETKAKALEKCEAPSLGKIPKRWRDQPALMDFLRSL